MMKTTLALFFLAATALAQDRPPGGDPPRPERPREQENPPPPGAPRDGTRPRPPGAPGEGENPRAPGGREGLRRPPPPPVNPEELRQWLSANEPETLLRLSQAELSGRPEDVRRILGEAAGRMHDWSDLKQRDPKAFEKVQEMRRLEREGMDLAEAARRASPEEKDAATKKLQENLSRQFDLREEQRIRELAELKRRVDSLEKALGDRKANKERIVEKRRRELLGERVDDDW